MPIFLEFHFTAAVMTSAEVSSGLNRGKKSKIIHIKACSSHDLEYTGVEDALFQVLNFLTVIQPTIHLAERWLVGILSNFQHPGFDHNRHASSPSGFIIIIIITGDAGTIIVVRFTAIYIRYQILHCTYDLREK
jgi:hypothetical protein